MDKKPKLLIIEDDLLLARSLIMYFGHHGWTVEHVADGDLGLEMVPTFLPDIVMCDVLLPKHHGIYYSKQIRETPGGDDCILAIMSATYKDPQQIQQDMFDVGADIFFMKPFNLVEVHSKLNAMVAERWAEQEVEALLDM